MANKIEFIVLGDVKDLESKLAGVKKGFDTLGKNAGIALAGLTASAYGFVEAARQQEMAVNQLNQAMKNQGTFTEQASKDLQDYASALQRVSLFGDENIIQAQATLAQLGLSTDLTKQLTKATLDLAQAKGMDLNSAAQLIVRSIGTESDSIRGTTVVLDGMAGSTQKAESAIRELNKQFGGQAEAASKGLGSTIVLKNALSDLAEEIGMALAPTVERFAKQLTTVTDLIKQHPEIAKMAAEFLVLGIQVSAAAVAFSVLSNAGIKLGLAFTFLRSNLMWILPLVTAVGAAFAGWNIGKWISDVTGLSDAISRLGASLGEMKAQATLGPDYISEEDFRSRQESEGWIARAEARKADLLNQQEIHAQEKTLQDEKMQRILDFQAQINQMTLDDIAKMQNDLTVQNDMTKNFEAQKTKIIQDEMKKRDALREADKSSQLAAINFAKEMTVAYGKESKAAFFILKALRIAEIWVNSAAASMNIAAHWAWNPPVMASLQAQNRVLTALNIATVLGTTLAGFAVGTPSVPGDQMAMIHDKEMIIPKSFSDAIRSGELSLSGGSSSPGGESGIYFDFTGAQFNGVTDKLVEEIFTKASENIANRTLAFRSA